MTTLTPMIPVEQALQIVLANLPARRVEQIALAAALGRILASDVVADSNVPPFRRSAVDGFAVRADSPITSGKDLLERLKKDPSSIAAGITALGGNNHIACQSAVGNVEGAE